METLQVKKLHELATIPSKGSPKAAGYDLSCIEEYTLMPMEIKVFKTGLSIAIPSGMYGRIAPRSGLAAKNGIDVLAGVIDEDYRGELGIVLVNFGKTEKKFEVGSKIAQIIFEFYNSVNVVEVADLSETTRGVGGFGSTDKKPAENVIPITNRDQQTFNFQSSPSVKTTSPEKTYETRTDILEKWKEHGGVSGRPTNYETLIREREKTL